MAQSHIHIFMIPLRSPAPTDFDALITPLGPPTNSTEVIKKERDEFRQAFSDSIIIAFYSVRMSWFSLLLETSYCLSKIFIPVYLYFTRIISFIILCRLYFFFSIIDLTIHG